MLYVLVALWCCIMPCISIVCLLHAYKHLCLSIWTCKIHRYTPALHSWDSNRGFWTKVMIVLGPNKSVYMFERHIQFRYMVQYITIMQHIHTPSVPLGVRKRLRLVILFLHHNKWPRVYRYNYTSIAQHICTHIYLYNAQLYPDFPQPEFYHFEIKRWLF